MKALSALSTLLVTFGLGTAAQAASRCSIQAYDGHYLTAVGGGGQVVEPIHSNASQVGAWEIFTLKKFVNGNPSGNEYAFATSRGYLVTVVGGGGRTTDVIHTDGNRPSNWERIALVSLGGGVYALKTKTGNYLTAQDSGGRTTDVIHSNAVRIGNWEKFRIKCGL